MASQPDMLPTAKPPRAKPRVLMHFTDAGYSSCGTMADMDAIAGKRYDRITTHLGGEQ